MKSNNLVKRIDFNEIIKYLSSMNFQKLAHFREAAKTLHYGKAGKILNITASAVSHSILSLEEELGCKLFFKQGKRVYLTPEGKKLSLHADALMVHVQRVKTDLSTGQNASSGFIRIGATHGLVDKWVAPQWARISAPLPNLKSELLSLRSADLMDRVANNEIDIGFCFNPLPHPKLNIEFLSKGRLVIAIRRNHPTLKLRKKSEIIEFLNESPAIAPKSIQGIEVCEDHDELKRLGIKPNYKIAYDSYPVAIQIIASGYFWALIPEIFAAKVPNKIGIIDLPGFQAEFRVCAVTPKKGYLPSTGRELLTAVSEVVSTCNSK